MLSDNKHNELRSRLKSLPKIKARKDFHERLLARIHEHERYPARFRTRVEPAYLIKLREWSAFIFRPSLTPAYALTTVLLLVILVYFAFLSQTKDTGKFVYESTPVSQQSEFVIYKHQDRDITAITQSTDELSETENYSSTTFPEKHMSDVDVYRSTEKLKDESIPKERMMKKSDVPEEKNLDNEKGYYEQEFAPANIRKTETEKTDRKEEKVKQKKAVDSLSKIKAEDKTLDEGIEDQRNLQTQFETKKDTAKVKGEKLQQEPDTNRK